MTERPTRPDARTLVLQPDLAELSRARHFVSATAREAGFEELRVFDIALLTSEATANAIEHAPVKGQVSVTTLLHVDRLEVQVAGPGEFQTPDRSLDARSRGLGLPLMAKLSDHLALYSAPEGGTLLTLTFYREGHSHKVKGSPLPPTLLEMFETGDRLEAVFGAMPEGFAIYDRDLRCVYLNDAMVSLDGRPRGNLLGKGLSPLDRRSSILPDLFAEARSTGREVTKQAKHPYRDTWVEVSVIPFAGGYALFMRDISEKRHTEGELLQGSMLLDLSTEAIFAWEPDGPIRYWNAGAEKLYGFSREEALGSISHELLCTVFPRSKAQTVKRLLAKGEWEGELTHCHKDGHEVAVASRMQLLHTADEVLILETNHDITEHRRAAEDIHAAESKGETEAEERFRAFSQNLPGVAWIKDAQGRHVYRSGAYTKRFGTSAEDWLGKTDAEMWPPEVAEEFRRNDQAVLESGEVLRVVERTIDKDGYTSYWLTSKFPFTNAAGEQFVGGVGIDITARIEAEEALRLREERYRFLAEENERLYRQQLDIAERLQLALLNIPSEIGQVRVGHLYRSATEAARVGGDFYDVFEAKDELVVVLVGDVAGHGIEAARTATLVKDVVHAFAHQTVRPQEVLRRTNGLLVEKELPGFVTLFLGILDSVTGEFHFASAGHPNTLLRRASGQIQALGAGSAPLGVHAEATWKRGLVGLEAGDLLLLYTDGVIEARRNKEFFGEKRLETLLRRKRLSVERLPHTIVDQVLAFSGGDLRDDVAVLALSFAGPAPGARQDGRFTQESLLP